MYSHNANPSADIVDDLSNSNVNIYLGCEAAGGGWSTSGGTVVRFNLIDGAQHWASFDYPLHSAGSFDAITNVWMQVVLVSNYFSLSTYNDGRAAGDYNYGYYTGAMVANNIAYPHAGVLSSQLQGFTMASDLVLGSRGDLNGDRHFVGRMAGLQVASYDMSRDDVQCIFQGGEDYLPTQLAGCESTPPTLTDITFLADTTDRSGNRRAVTVNGQAVVGVNGAKFNGQGDDITIANFDYASDAHFTISLWFTKEACTGGVYEYLFSHHFNDQADTWDHSYIDIYLACEEAGAGWSTATGSIMRYWLRDEAGVEAMMDYSIHSAGSFDTITDMWVHAILVVDPASLVTYADGTLVRDSDYGFYGSPGQNSARPSPGVLNPPFLPSGTFNLMTDLFLGGRIDRDGDRHFHGKLALFQIYEGPVTAVQARCVS
jgi:hypothetical protein